MGNLFSLKNAFAHLGYDVKITSRKEDIASADGIVLPGVGAFGKAMESLRDRDLVSVLKDTIYSGQPLLGICLGLQLLMSKSYEFGEYEGLNLIEGEVRRFNFPSQGHHRFKIPHMGWNKIYKPVQLSSWSSTILKNIGDCAFMYFVHSFYIQPNDSRLVLSMTTYGQTEFCSSLHYKNIFGCQFHPERSGPEGIHIYKNFIEFVQTNKEKVRNAQTRT